MRRSSRQLAHDAAAPGPQHLRSAVDAIVNQLRRIVLLQAWERWKPTLTPGQVAQRIFERQRIRLQRSASLDSEDTRMPREFREGDGHHADHDNAHDDPLTSTPCCVSSSMDFHSTNAFDAAATTSGARGRTRSRVLMRDRKTPGDVGGGSAGSGGCCRRSRSSPAAGNGGNASYAARETTRRKSVSFSSKVRTTATGAVSGRWSREGGSNPQSGKKGGEQSAWRNSSTIQHCFKEERASFIHDLQVLHRQLEAKDRYYARRENENRAVVVRAEAEVRAAREQVDALRGETAEAAAAKAAAEATAQALDESVAKHTAEAESLRTRLRHCERQHHDQMEVERRQRKLVSEETSTERRRLKFAAETARKKLFDARREWAAEKDVVMMAVRDAGHRAELAATEATEAKAHAVLLEERLQQTLEREAALNAELETQRDSAHKGEQRASMAESFAARAHAAAAAQKESFLEQVKSLKEQASRAEIMRDRERITRKEMQAQLERAKFVALADLSKAREELSEANLRVASFLQQAYLSRAENEVLRRRVEAAEAVADSAIASKELDTCPKEACTKNIRIAAEAGEERVLLEEQWRHQEGIKRLALQRAPLLKSGERTEGGESGEPGLADVLSEVEDLRETVTRLLLEKEALLRQQPLANASGEYDGERSVELVEGDKDPVGAMKVVGDARPAAPFSIEIHGACSAGDGASFGVRSGGLGTESGHGETRRHASPFQWKLPYYHRGRCAHDARTAVDQRTDEIRWSCDFEKSESTEKGEGRRGGSEKYGRSCVGAMDRDCEPEKDCGPDNEGERPRDGHQCLHRCPEASDETYGFNAKWVIEKNESNAVAGVTNGEGRRPDEGFEFRGGAGNRCRPQRIVADRLLRAYDEDLLAPRGGPAPVPSSLTPRHPRASYSRPTMGAEVLAAQLRTCYEQERRRRRWEHDTLLALLREEGVAPGKGSPGDNHGVPRHLSPHGNGPDDGIFDDDRDNRSDDGAHNSARSVMRPEAGERGRSAERITTPLTSETWNDVLVALRRSLQLRHGGRIDEEGQQWSTAAGTSVGGDDGGRQGGAALDYVATEASHSLKPSRAGRRLGGSSDSLNNDGDVIDTGRSSSEFDESRYGCDYVTEGEAEDWRYSDANVVVSNQKGDEGVVTGGDAGPSTFIAQSSALASVLRELLSSTPGVSEEEVRDAPLPDLVGALRCEWGRLLEKLAAIQEEAERARQGADLGMVQATATVVASISSTDSALPTDTIHLTVPFEKRLPLPPLHPQPSGARGQAGPAVDLDASTLESGRVETAPTGQHIAELEAALAEEKRKVASMRAKADTEAEEAPTGQHVAELEAALAEEKRKVASMRAKADTEAEEAAKKFAEAEHERSDATYRLAAALRDLAAERAEGVARLAVLRTDLRSMVTALEKAEVLAAAAKEEAVASQRGLEDLRDEAEGLKKAAGSAQRRAEVAEDRARKLATAEKEREAGFAQDIELAREEGREQERRKGEQRVKALESSLEKLAETGSAAEGLSMKQLEVTRELSIERDGLLKENERAAGRLNQLTSALREQREERTHLAHQLLDRERGLEALRAQGDVERAKLAKLQSEVDKAQGVCRDMADRLLELQEELRTTREKLNAASQEVQSLRRSKDRIGAGWEEARRLRDRLEGAERVGGKVSERAQQAEAQAERESRRARHLEVKIGALQNQLDQVPNDLLVAHAEKRVLQGALEKAKQQTEDAKASAELEIRRRDADMRNFASTAAVQQERCGKRLREQALIIHELTLQGFTAEAHIGAQASSAFVEAERTENASGEVTSSSGATVTRCTRSSRSNSLVESVGTSASRNVGVVSTSAHALRRVPRRVFPDTEERCSGARRRRDDGNVRVVVQGERDVDCSARLVPSSAAIGANFDTGPERRFGIRHSSCHLNACESGRERGRGAWEGHSLDSSFPVARFGAPSAPAENSIGRPNVEICLRRREDGERAATVLLPRQDYRGLPLSDQGSQPPPLDTFYGSPARSRDEKR